MHKPAKHVVVLPLWTLIALVTTLLTLFPAFLFCVREIVALKSCVDDQQLKILSLESITTQLGRQTVKDKISSKETSEMHQKFFKEEVWIIKLNLIQIVILYSFDAFCIQY